MIKFQQSHALTSHFESFWSIVHLILFLTGQMQALWTTFLNGQRFSKTQKLTSSSKIQAMKKFTWNCHQCRSKLWTWSKVSLEGLRILLPWKDTVMKLKMMRKTKESWYLLLVLWSCTITSILTFLAFMPSNLKMIKINYVWVYQIFYHGRSSTIINFQNKTVFQWISKFSISYSFLI